MTFKVGRQVSAIGALRDMPPGTVCISEGDIVVKYADADGEWFEADNWAGGLTVEDVAYYFAPLTIVSVGSRRHVELNAG